MIRRLFLAALAACAVSCKRKPPLQAATVQAAQEALARCQRWEVEPGDGAKKDCPAAVQKALEARKLYPDDSESAAIIVQLADSLQGKYGSGRLAPDCEAAQAYFKAAFAVTKVPNPYYQSLCPKQAATCYNIPR